MLGPPTLAYQSIRQTKSKQTQQGGPYWSFEYYHIMKSFIFDLIKIKIAFNKFCFTLIEFFATWPKTNLNQKYRLFMIFELEMWKWQCLKSWCVFLHHPIFISLAQWDKWKCGVSCQKHPLSCTQSIFSKECLKIEKLVGVLTMFSKCS